MLRTVCSDSTTFFVRVAMLASSTPAFTSPPMKTVTVARDTNASTSSIFLWALGDIVSVVGLTEDRNGTQVLGPCLTGSK